MRLQSFVERTGNNIRLLFRCKLDEVNGIAGYTDGQLRIFFRMLLGIQKSLAV